MCPKSMFSICIVAMVVLQSGNPSMAAGRPTAPSIDWPEATARLAEARTRAETCVGVLKHYGSASQIADGRLKYGSAQGKIDGVISGLITALAEKAKPSSLPNLQLTFDNGSTELVDLCDAARKLIPRSQGERGPVADIVKAALEPVMKAASDGVSALYNNYIADAELTRRTIQTQLEAAKWPSFDAITPE